MYTVEQSATTDSPLGPSMYSMLDLLDFHQFKSFGNQTHPPKYFYLTKSMKV